MKHFLLLLIATGFFLTGCKKEQYVNEEKSTFSLKNINGEVIKSLPSDLLLCIHKDLVKQGRERDAEKLYELYDLKTGQLKGTDVNNPFNKDYQTAMNELLDTGISSYRSQYSPHGVFAYCHIQGRGDMGPFTQAEYMGADYPYPYAGTVGRSLRLEGMWLQTESSLYTTRPTIFYSLRNYDYTWTSIATWGQFTGTRGISKPVMGLKIWTTTPGYSVWYKCHNTATGWNQPWHNDGQFAGIDGRWLEAFAFHIVKY